ncbi:hypothetical protein F4677DRAFT_102441 [Hypoxylon crocopeplum]|nr:hypothetical protein F4677DRAFT_102441 [Hypoxylon crocopeplum]
MSTDIYQGERGRCALGWKRLPNGRFTNVLREEMTRGKDEPPLAIKLLENSDSINPQMQSPVFAKLPKEIRELIWGFALTRYEDFDTRPPYDINTYFARPGQAGVLRIDVDLLRTCRTVYVETFLTPFQVNPLAVFDGDDLNIPPWDPLMRTLKHPFQCDKLRTWQFANLRAVDLSVHQYELEGGSLERVSRLVGALGRHKGYENQGITVDGHASFAQPAAVDGNGNSSSETQDVADSHPSALQKLLIGRKITHLTIRMSRIDLWTWNCYATDLIFRRLRLEPMINTTHFSKPYNCLAMVAGHDERICGREPEFEMNEEEKLGCWGTKFKEYWPDLTELKLVLETMSFKENQLEDVVTCAKLWTFPLDDEYHLAWNGRVETTTRWQGGVAYPYGCDVEWLDIENSARIKSWDSTLRQWTTRKVSQCGYVFVVRALTYERKRNKDHPAPERSYVNLPTCRYAFQVDPFVPH